MRKIVLASASPRREALLRQAGMDFELRPTNVSEDVGEEVSPYDVVKALAERKAAAALKSSVGDEIIIAADTVVDLHGAIMNKPNGPAEAADMLKRLQGEMHSVYTGLALINKTALGCEMMITVDTTEVYMRPLTDGEIAAYIATGEPFDKAGGYAIQGKGAFLIERVEGDYYTVMGLPLVKLYMALREWGVELF